MRISVCIPAYNRPSLLPALLDSILSQDYTNYEIVVCEDNSPMRNEIRAVINDYVNKFPDRIKYFENNQNLGYDGNIRNLIEKATGDYCLFMGNDDLMCKGALKIVADAITKYDKVGVVLRSYAAFDEQPENVVQVFRYFADEIFFPSGAETIATFYRRSVVISGMVLHRQESLKYSTNRFDGTLLYQLYLVASILTRMNGVFLPELLALYRNGGVPDFGNNENEKGKYVPSKQTPESSLHFVRGMLKIAKWIDRERNIRIFNPIMRDAANYLYPFLSIQACQPFSVFVRYSFSLAKMGFGKFVMFYAYFFSILLLGTERLNYIINRLKTTCGHTPVIGNIYQGEGK